MMNMHIPLGKVDRDFLKQTALYQKKEFVRIGRFDLDLLCQLTDLLSEETLGEVELLMMADNTLPDSTKSGLLVVKYDGDNYIALAGMTDR